MKTILIPPHYDLIKEVSSHLKSDKKDYSQYLIVFPGKRPSHFLRRMLAQREKGSFIPPALFSMDEFVNFIYEEKLGLFRKRLETIDAVGILYDIHRTASEPMGGNSFMSLDSFFPIGLKIYKDIEELYIEGVHPEMVKDIDSFAGEGVPEQTVKRLHSLSFFYEKFYSRIDREYSTRSLRYRSVSQMIDTVDFITYAKIIMAGFFALTASEKKLFKKLLKCESTLLIFQHGPGIRNILKQLEIDAEVKEEGIEPDIHFYTSPDTHGQVFGLSRILKSSSEKGELLDDNTLIMLPASETLFPLLHQTLSLLDVDSYNISLGYPLHRTPVYGFLNNLMELAASEDSGRFYVPAYLTFALHPYTKNIYCENKTDITRTMFHAIEENLTKNRTKTFITLTEIEDIVYKFDQGTDSGGMRTFLREIHQNTIKKFLSFNNTEDFAVKGREVLTYIANNSTACLHPFFHPFAKDLIESFHVLSKSLIGKREFEESAGYFNLFKKYVMTRYTPFTGTPLAGVQVLGFLETRNLKFDRVFILDVNEDVLPDIRKDDTILPFRAREMLGLPTYKDSERLTSYYFETLIRGAKDVHLFFIEGNKKEKSRFIERLLWKKQKEEKKIDIKEYVTSVQYSISLENYKLRPVPKTQEMAGFLKGFSYSATSLDVYLKCPLQFYYAYVMGLRKREGVSGGIKKADVGRFVHIVLSAYFSKRRGRKLTEKHIDTREMDRTVDELFERHYMKDPAGAAYLLKIQIKNRLRDLLERYYLPLIKEQLITILDVDCKINIRKDSFNLEGEIDVIEKRDDRVYIVDYKTAAHDKYLKTDFKKLMPSGAERESWSGAAGSIQLPFYLFLYSEKTGKRVEDMNGLFLLLGRSALDRRIELPFFETGEEEIKKYYTMKKIIWSLLKEITDPAKDFSPASDKKGVCSFCNFSHMCGING